MLTDGQTFVLLILTYIFCFALYLFFSEVIFPKINKNIEKNKTIKLICNYIKNFILGLIIIAIIIFIVTGAIGLW